MVTTVARLRALPDVCVFTYVVQLHLLSVEGERGIETMPFLHQFKAQKRNLNESLKHSEH